MPCADGVSSVPAYREPLQLSVPTFSFCVCPLCCMPEGYEKSGMVYGRGGYGFGVSSFISPRSVTGRFLTPVHRLLLAFLEFVFLFAVALSCTEGPRIGS